MNDIRACIKTLHCLQNLSNIKLAPHNLSWNHGSGIKNTSQVSSSSTISLSKNMYSVLENAQTDPTSLRGMYIDYIDFKIESPIELTII